MKNEKIFKLANIVVAVLAVVAFIMLFVPAIKWSDTEYSGTNLVFGYTAKTSGIVSISAVIFEFSFMNMLTYILVLVALVLALLCFVKESKVLNFVLIGVTLVAGIFFLLTKNFAVLNKDYMQTLSSISSNYTFAGDSNVSLAAGPIVGAVMMFLSFALATVKAVLPFFKKK